MRHSEMDFAFARSTLASTNPAGSGDKGVTDMGMGLNFDLATVAGMAGLGGSAVAAIAASLVFKGLIMRILSQIVVTTVLSFVGFIALLHFLGFEIIPPKQIAGVKLPGNT